MIIGTFQLYLKHSNFSFQIIYYFNFRINVLLRDVRDIPSTCCIIQRRNRFLEIMVRRRDTSDHKTVGIPSEGLFQQLGQFRVPIRNMRQRSMIFSFLQIRESIYNFSQVEETLVYVNGFFGGQASCARRGYFFRPGEIYQLQFTRYHVIVVRWVDGLYSYAENSMRSGRCMV